MKKKILTIILIFLTFQNFATGLKVENPILYFDDDGVYAQVWVSWKNAWRNEKNYDGAWLFLKLVGPDGGYIHLKLSDAHQAVSIEEKTLGLILKSSPDSAGLFISLAGNYRGDVSAVLKLKLSRNQFRGVAVRQYRLQCYGMEMVYIPAGAHSIGDTSRSAVANGAYFQSAGNGKPGNIFRINKENDIIEVSDRNGALYYTGRLAEYEGDKGGPIPAAFPKGVNSFIMMKYEPTQELYAAFLNSLPKSLRDGHAKLLQSPGYYQLRGTIKKDSSRYLADVKDAPLNFIAWSNALSLADWCGLRPVTDLEFSKACRGTKNPTAKEYPWGGASKYLVKRAIAENGKPYFMGGIDEKNLTDNNLVTYGASYYWVMDLAGSTWERVVTLGHSDGRNFTGTHGDGILDEAGFATNTDWPAKKGLGGGFGFRGGGFYIQGRDYHEYNPFSPIEYRPYGSWAGHDVSEAYGCRFVRSW